MAHWFNSRHWSCWHPCSWQGWSVTLIYIFSVLFIFFKADINSNSASDTIIRMTLPFIVLSIIFVIICRKTSQTSK